MARIQTYEVDNIISENDIVIGSDADNVMQTKNYLMSQLRQYINSGLEPVIGGNLKITTIQVDDESILSPEDYFNNLQPALDVLQYEIIFLILNGVTYIFRKNNGLFGLNEEQTLPSDFTTVQFTLEQNFNSLSSDSLNITEPTNGNFFINIEENIEQLVQPNEDNQGEIYSGFNNLTHFLRSISSRKFGGIKVEEFANTIDLGLDVVNIGNGSALYSYDADNIQHKIKTIKAGSGIQLSNDNIDNSLVISTVSVPPTPPVFDTTLYVTKTMLFDAAQSVFFANGGESFNQGVYSPDTLVMEFNEDISLNPTVARLYIYFNLYSNNENITSYVISAQDNPFNFLINDNTVKIDLGVDFFNGFVSNQTQRIDFILAPESIVGHNGYIPDLQKFFIKLPVLI